MSTTEGTTMENMLKALVAVGYACEYEYVNPLGGYDRTFAEWLRDVRRFAADAF